MAKEKTDTKDTKDPPAKKEQAAVESPFAKIRGMCGDQAADALDAMWEAHNKKGK